MLNNINSEQLVMFSTFSFVFFLHHVWPRSRDVTRSRDWRHLVIISTSFVWLVCCTCWSVVLWRCTCG